MLFTEYQETCFIICHMILCHIYRYVAVVCHLCQSVVLSVISSWQVYCVSVGLPCSLLLLYFLHILKMFEALCGKDKHCK